MLSELLFKRSLENPSTPLSNPADWAYDSLGAGVNASGVRINGQTALGISPWWRGITVLSGSLACLPLYAFRRVDGGKNKQIDRNHPASKLAKYPTGEAGPITSSVFKMTLQAHVMGHGNGYAFIDRDQGGKPTGLWPLNPDKMYPIRVGGMMAYAYTPDTTDPSVLDSQQGAMESARKLKGADVLHIKGLSPDGLLGYSVFRVAADTLGRSKATSLYGARYFRNSARPAVLLKHPKRLTEQAAKNLRASWDKLHQGVDNSHRTAVLEEGMDVASFQINAKDSQLLESETFSLLEIANFLNLPPHKVGHPTRTSYSSLEQENRSYLDESLMRWLIAWEEEWELKLLTEQEKRSDSVTVEFVKQALLMGDMGARSSFYNAALQTGWMNRDEVRALENLPPIPDGEGEKFLMPSNMKEVGEDEPEPEPTPPPPAEPEPEPEPDEEESEDERKLRKVHADLLAYSLGRIGRRIGEHARRMSRKPASYGKWLDDLERDHLEVARRELALPLEGMRLVHGTTHQPDEVAQSLIDEMREKLLDLSGQHTSETLPNGVESFVSSWEQDGPLTIVSSLTQGARNELQQTA